MSHFKLAIGGLAVECCTFSPVLTEFDDIHILRGDALRAQYPFLEDATYGDVQAVPLVRGKATPGGPVTRAAYDQIMVELLDGLRAGAPWDGVYLDLHGALYVEGMTDAEGHLIAAVRAAVGPDAYIAASYDLHGNVSQRVIDQLDILTAYRTTPHVDVDKTRGRAFRLLVEALHAGARPVTHFVPLPMLLPGEVAMTSAEPAKSLYQSLPDIIRDHQLLDASYLVGYAWADEARVCAAAVAIGVDKAQVKVAAQHLAQTWWDARADFQFGMPTGTIPNCIEMARAARATPFFISDAGDNITGGGVGDVTLLLAAMLRTELQNAVCAAIVDAQAVAACFEAGIGADLSFDIGGKLDTRHGQPLSVNGCVLALHNDEVYGQQAVLQVDGVQVVLAGRRVPFTTRAQFTQLGIDLMQKAIVAVKLGYLFPELRAIAAGSVLALTPGAINPDVHTISYQHIQRPMYPLDAAMEWPRPQV